MGVPTRCPQCGYSTNVQKSSEFPLSGPPLLPLTYTTSSHPPNDEINLLYQEISRIDNAIRQLHEERAARCRRLNEIQSPTAKLPSNLISTIFEFVCPPSEYNTSHQRVRRINGKPLVLPVFALCAVSSRWRQIALSMPRFWAKLDWQWKYHLSPDDTVALLCTYFTRASPLPFDLKLTINEKWEIENTIPFNHPDHIDDHLDALKRTIFFENSHRIGSLKLDAPNRWLRLISKSFTNLSDLSLRSGRIDTYVDLSTLPSLTRVTLINTKVAPILPWKQITSIYLVCPHINVALELLKRCPNLIEFHSHHPNPVKNGSITQTLKDTISLPHIEWLDWTSIGSLWDDALFRHVHLPSLRRLTLAGDASWSHDWDHVLTNFLTRLPSTVDLELGYVRDFTGGPMPMLKTIFHALPTLQNLTLLEDDHNFLEKVFSLLIPSSSSDPVIYLPALRSLTLQSPDSEYARDGGVFTRLRGAPQQLPTIVQGDIFVDLVRQRRRVLHLPAFRLDLNFSPAWRLKSRDELIVLVEEGCELELVEKSRRVDWLSIV